MSIKKALMALSVAAACAVPGMASASPITVGGVTWDPDSIVDFSSFSLGIRQVINSTTGAVSGYGVISTMNLTPASSFVPGGELTFQFGGFTPVTFGALPNVPGQIIGYTGGWVKVYVGNSIQVNQADFTTLNAANTGDGVLWLELAGHALGANNITFTGTVAGMGSDVSQLTGIGLLDVVGGAAAANFDTNTRQDGADFTFSNSFTTFLAGLLDAGGTGNFKSDSIPEPASLGLVGLAMLGLGAIRRKKQA